MAGRSTADPSLRTAEQVPGPGQYGAPMPMGAEMGGGRSDGRTERGYSIAGREAWVREGSSSGGSSTPTPGPADYNAPPGATARPMPAPPSFSMGERTKVIGQHATDAETPSPFEYSGGGGGQPGDASFAAGPSFTFGHRTAVGGGVFGNLKDAATLPGPASYNVARYDDYDAADDRSGVRRGFTMGMRTTHPSDLGGGGEGGAGDLGPGFYHNEHDGMGCGGGRSGVTIAGRTAPAGVLVAGLDSPGVGKYDVGVASQPSGASFSFGVRTATGGAFTAGASLTPGPGEYGGPMIADDAGGLLEGVPAFSFGLRGTFGAPAVAPDGPGPGGAGAGGGGAKPALNAPKFSFGLRTAMRSPFGNGDEDGSGAPGENNPDHTQPSEAQKLARFTMGVRAQATTRAEQEAGLAPGPCSYDLAAAEAARERGSTPGGVLEPGVRFPTAVRRSDFTTASPGPAYFIPSVDDLRGGGPAGPRGYSMVRGVATNPNCVATGGDVLQPINPCIETPPRDRFSGLCTYGATRFQTFSSPCAFQSLYPKPWNTQHV